MNAMINGLNEVEKISPSAAQVAPPAPVDAVIHVSISHNKMEACLFIDPPMNGGKVPSLEILEEALVSCNITYGVDNAKLQEIIANPIYSEKIMIARGTIPENGENGTHTFLFRLEKDCKPKEKQDGTVDYRDLDVVENVCRGQMLCQIKHPTDGSAGMAVTGEKLRPVKGKAEPSLLGKNTELSEDGTAIFSKIDGQVNYENGKIQVTETYVIKGDVDNTTGNVKVVSNVLIGGTVLPKFAVEAGGNIEILSTVGSATLRANGNILLRSGIIGCEVHCQGDLTSKFIENCSVYVDGNVTADYIVNSNIHCGKGVNLIGFKGTILGGCCRARQNITARNIGSIAEVETSLKISIDPAVIERQQELGQQIPDLEKQIESLKSLIALLRQFEAADRLTADKKATLEKALLSYATCTGLYSSCTQELAQLKHSLQVRGHGQVICPGKIFPGTTIEIGSAKIRVNDILTGTLFHYSQGAIGSRPVS